MSSLIERWRAGDQLDANNVRLPHSTRKTTPVERRLAEPAGLRKPRMKDRSTQQAANRAANRAAAINDQLQREGEHLGPAPSSRIGESSGVDVSATQAADQYRVDKHAEGRVVDTPVREGCDEGPVAEPAAPTQGLPGHANGTPAENSTAPLSNRQDVQQETARTQSGEARATDIRPPTAEDDGKVTENVLDELLDEMLAGEAKQRDIGEYETQECVRWGREHGDLDEAVRIEAEKYVAQERATALAQLQNQIGGRVDEQGSDSTQREAGAPIDGASRPVTHLDLPSLIAAWRERGTHRRDKPAGIRKSWMKDKEAGKAANRAGRKPSPSTNISETHVTGPDQSGNSAERQVADVPVQEVPTEGNTSAGPFSRLRDVEHEAVQGPSEEAATTVFPPALGDGDQGRAGGSVVEAERVESESNADHPGPVEPTRPEARAEAAHIRFNLSAENKEYNFKELNRSTLTDPGGDPTNVADSEPWPPAVPLPSIRANPEPVSSDGKVSITFHIYERSQWRVADVLSVDPSAPSGLQTTVWRYKRREIFVYDMRLRMVSVSSSFRAATSDGANVLLLNPKEAKAQMDPARLIEPPSRLRKKSRRN
ncbi:hypothetical protein ACJ73_03896 [Blastomyces percursus]|uniref:Uncharacterized protein n=1 Tax=Blastomyces percursus TaxID=1658174 RepID=A0A1J9RAP8_9EURO|nr:hypothetical protein ACJ73_03896 [Blastomyces percursus]